MNNPAFPPVITTVYAPDQAPDLCDTVLACLKQTASECGFHPHRLIAAIDVAGDRVRERLKDDGWEIIELKGHRSTPRMTALLRVAFDQVADCSWAWTVEHDTLVDGANMLVAAQAAATLETRNIPVAGLECAAYNSPRHKHITRPTSAYRLRHAPTMPGVYEALDGLAFNCTLWNLSYIHNLNWTKIPPWARADQAFCKQIAARGGRFFVHMDAPCAHLRANAGVAARAGARAISE